MALDHPDLAFPFEDEVDYEKQTITELKGFKHAPTIGACERFCESLKLSGVT
jgi:hypothetical protein